MIGIYSCLCRLDTHTFGSWVSPNESHNFYLWSTNECIAGYNWCIAGYNWLVWDVLTRSHGFYLWSLQHVKRIVLPTNEITQAVEPLEAKIYSQTDIFSDFRLQRSEHHSSCARSSEQQDILALGQFSILETIVVCGNRKSCQKIHIVLALPLALPTIPYHSAAVAKFG